MFAEDKRNFVLEDIYKGSRDGWELEIFKEKVFNQGPTLILVRTSVGRVCGGYTSINWDGSDEYKRDNDAFVFSLDNNTKYTPTNYDHAIYTMPGGFAFGNKILGVRNYGNKLNKDNKGWCFVGTDNHYNVEGDAEGKSPLTGEKHEFTVSELEVYKVKY